MIVDRVLVQGGGVGGLVAATALAQRGAEVDIVARRHADAVLGVGLNQPSNALREIGGSFDDWVGDLANAISAESPAAYGPIEQVALGEPWFRGRIAVAGDAAHATSPHMAQGAAMAAEDAVVLAQELDRATDVDTALDAWYRRRLPRAGLVQDYSAALMRQEQGDTTAEDRELLRLSVPDAHARLAEAY